MTRLSIRLTFSAVAAFALALAFANTAAHAISDDWKITPKLKPGTLEDQAPETTDEFATQKRDDKEESAQKKIPSATPLIQQPMQKNEN